MPGTAGPHVGLTWGYSPGETGWGVAGFNPNFAAIETLLHLTVLMVESTPPGSPANGEAYIVGASATGAWAGREDDIAVWYTTGTPAWLYLTPATGYRAYNVDTGTYWLYDGAGWVEQPISGDVVGPGSAVAGNVPTYADTTGTLLADSGVPIDTVLLIDGVLTPGNFITTNLLGQAIDSGLAIGDAGTGDVVGPGSSVTGHVASYADATGKLIADSGTAVADLIVAGGALVAGNILTVDGSGDLVDTGVAVGSVGGGDVLGPASSTTGHIATYGDGTGKLLADSGLTAAAVAAGLLPAGTTQYDLLVWSGSAWTVQRARWGAGCYVPGVLTADQNLLFHRFDKAATIPANFGSYLGHASQAGGGVVATASTVLTVARALSASPTTFSTVGTITFASGTITPTFASTGGTAISFAQGDILRLRGPTTPDAGLADVFVTLSGYET